MPLTSGTRLGPYEILAPLGAGGMGEVYRARDTRLSREVAVKVLPAHLSASAEARLRFEREARSASSLNHPNICTVHDIGAHEGIDFLVMELLEGETLADRLARGPMPLRELLPVAVKLADALDRAHRSGLVHRDLKPGNVMLGKSGPKLLDFGLAKGIEASAPTALTATPTMTSPLTAAGTIVGTFQYMAPEQIEGKEADVRSDLWAFGAMLYEMTTGKRAFDGKTQASLIASILKEEPPAIPEVTSMTPVAFDRVVRRCLAKDPDDRWQTARDLAAELEWIAADGSQAGAPIPALPAPSPSRRRWRGAAAALAAVAIFAAGWLLHRPPATSARVIRSSLVLPAGTILDTDNTSISLSPDGMTLAYSGRDAGGRSGLWVRRLDSLDAQPLAGTAGASYPFWSPDGRNLGFFADGNLRKIPSTGGTAQTICDAVDGRGATWGAGGVIVFAPNPFGPLWQVPATGGAPSPATTEERPEWTHRNPRFLPDGKRLLFFMGNPSRNGEGAIHSLDLASGKTAMVLRAESEGLFVAPGYLAFVRDGNLMVQPMDPGTLQLTGEAVPIVEDVQFNTFRWTGTYAFSGDGMMLFRSGGIQTESQLSWFDLDGNRLGTLGEPATFWLNIELSPDGKRALATIRRADGKSDLWLYDVDRGLGQRFTFGDTAALNGHWSRDGQTVAFIDGGANVFLKAADGTGAPRVLRPDGGTTTLVTDWAPDGRHLLVVTQSADTQSDLMLLPVDGDTLAPLMVTPARETTGEFSPDGRWLAFVSDQAGRPEVYVVSFPGAGGKWQVSTTGASSFRWLPDGSGLVCVTLDGGLVSVPITPRGANLEIGAARPIFGDKGATVDLETWTLAPDGKRILAAVPVGGNVAPALTMVTNWPAALDQP